METGHTGLLFSPEEFKRGDRFIEIVQILDGQNMLVRPYGIDTHPITGRTETWRGKFVWMQGIDTSGYVDDQKVAIDGPFEVTGTKTYTTAIGGTQTVRILEPIDLSPLMTSK